MMKTREMKEVIKGEVYWADLPIVDENSNIQSGIRPVIIFCNWKAGKYSPVVQYIPITTEISNKKYLPVHVVLKSKIFSKKSMALPEQLGCIDKSRLLNKIGILSEEDMFKINRSSRMQQELDERDDREYRRQFQKYACV